MQETFLAIQTRYSRLKGESDNTGITATDKSNLNYAQREIVNLFPFSWSITKTNLTVTAGVSNMPTNFVYKWRVLDARQVVSGSSNDKAYEEINIEDIDAYSAGSYKYWLTYDTTNSVYVFNTTESSAMVQIYYHFMPVDMSADGDYLLIPDGEAVAYKAASQNWISDERNQSLAQDYKDKADKLVDALISQDLNFGPTQRVGSVIDYNPQLYGGGNTPGQGLIVEV